MTSMDPQMMFARIVSLEFQVADLEDERDRYRAVLERIRDYYTVEPTIRAWQRLIDETLGGK